MTASHEDLRADYKALETRIRHHQLFVGLAKDLVNHHLDEIADLTDEQRAIESRLEADGVVVLP